MAPDAPPDPIAVALGFTQILERLGITWLIGGSLASSVHGEPRTTNDVDVLADFRAEHLTGLLEAAGSEYYVSSRAIREAVELESSFNLIQLEYAMKVDLFIAGSDPFNRERLAHRQRVALSAEPEPHLFVDTAEHSILRKLEWYRRGGEISQRQLRDVLSILRTQGPRLDRERMALWAARLGISDLLEKAISDAGVAS